MNKTNGVIFAIYIFVCAFAMFVYIYITSSPVEIKKEKSTYEESIVIRNGIMDVPNINLNKAPVDVQDMIILNEDIKFINFKDTGIDRENFIMLMEEIKCSKELK